MPKIHGHTKYRGYSFKLCPYSDSYKVRFYDRGFAGNTTNTGITQANFTSVVTGPHPYTEGTMNYSNPGGNPGWMCWDDACPFFISNGFRYYEK